LAFLLLVFHSLGVETFVSKNILPEGTARVESTYCFPAEIAHGAVQDILERNPDYIFLPHFKDMESYENYPGKFLVLYSKFTLLYQKAFPEITEDKYLAPVISFMYGVEKASESFVRNWDVNWAFERT